ncbi:MAG: hypothetical protein IPM92_16740 [Saprospiraceae bacterium]|nr:hypothetical protein [Saprospiraceae bacterium]
MKTSNILTLKKFLLIILILFFLFKSGFAQSPCSIQYTFTVSGDSTTCQYTFTPNIPTQGVCSITWDIESSGYYGIPCDPSNITANPLTYNFCFGGNYKVTMWVHFCNGQSCYVSQTVYIGCVDADKCDPDPDRVDDISNPKVEVTYISPDTCNFNSVQTVTGCMFSATPGGNYYISCGWRWALRVHPTSCNYWTYYVQYDSIRSCGNYSCIRRTLDTNVLCIKAYIDRPIYIVATANSCCLPAGYQRGLYWTPTPASGNYNPIGDPTPTVSTLCTAYRNCPNYTYCIENPQDLNQTSGWPATCFSGGGFSEQRLSKIDASQFAKQQHVEIYNLQGGKLFDGLWKFTAHPSAGNVVFPGTIKSGIYFVNFVDLQTSVKLVNIKE